MSDDNTKRSRISQADIPAYPLSEALRIPRVICDEFARQPVKPLHLAQGLNMKPASSKFRMLTGSALAYGLTTAAYNSSEIGITDLGKRAVVPTYEGDDLVAQREALQKPRVLNEFLNRYNGSKFPSDKIGENVLVDMGIAGDRAAIVFKMIKTSAQLYGLTKEIKGEHYVDLSNGLPLPPEGELVLPDDDDHMTHPPEDISFDDLLPADIQHDGHLQSVQRVFITHGRNKEIVDQLKELLTFGKFEPVVAVDNDTVAKPVPEKVMDEMRSCGAAVIHVGKELKLLSHEGQEIVTLNQNVLIEIGAALALYGQKFILLVEKGVELPSNLQGLYQVRYEGDKLDYDATMKLLKAFNDFAK